MKTDRNGDARITRQNPLHDWISDLSHNLWPLLAEFHHRNVLRNRPIAFALHRPTWMLCSLLLLPFLFHKTFVHIPSLPPALIVRTPVPKSPFGSSSFCCFRCSNYLPASSLSYQPIFYCSFACIVAPPPLSQIGLTVALPFSCI